MDCIRFNKDISAFMNKQLDDAELNDFLNHLKSCRKCAEELEVNYIVHEGIIRLEDRHASLNLASAYQQVLRSCRAYLHVRKRLITISNVFRTLTFWTLVGTIFVYLRILFAG